MCKDLGASRSTFTGKADPLFLSPLSLSQTVVIDARAHMLGRLASIVAKQILSGYHVVSVFGCTECVCLVGMRGRDSLLGLLPHALVCEQ